jgi:N-methylhydantoinase A
MRVATDIGGTFTDLVYVDENTGETGIRKSDTTPRNFERGVMETIKRSHINNTSVNFFVHGSTVIINALTERKGACTGLITTAGFRDVLEIRRANRPDLYNLRFQKPDPFVPRYLRLEATERISHKGEVLTPLVEEEVKAAAHSLVHRGVDAIGICFIHSYINPVHEERAAEIVRKGFPDVFVTASHEITREWREYERTSTAVLNSYVQPVAAGYLDSLEEQLNTEGIRGAKYAMQSNGGTATFESARRAPIGMVESGPVGGVLGAAAIGELIGESNIISLDIGGTTAKCSLIDQGEVKVTTDFKLEWTRTFPGYPIKVPVVDIVEIGAGGGSIARLDEAGALHVGPQSAGADPGPACYGRGGDDPTVTDANLIAGRINPGYFLGGEIRLHVDKARSSLRPIGKHFGVDEEQAALGVIRLANGNMVNALKLISVHRGYDPRDFTLVAFGGGGPMHATALARDLRIGRVLVPPQPGVFSAWGMLMTDLRFDLIITQIQRSDQTAPRELEELWVGMESQAGDHLVRENVENGRIAHQRYIDMRYAGQEHTVKVPFGGSGVTAQTVSEAVERFHSLHEQAYTFRLESPVEFVNFHLTSLGMVHKPRLPEVPAKEDTAAAVKGHRPVDFDELGRREATIYERDRLSAQACLQGPAIVEEPSCTTVVFPGDLLTVDAHGNLLVEIEVGEGGW